MSDRPAPLTPTDCDTAGNDWFPFYGDRLMRSKWWRRASDIARARNVMLWWRAFKERPAGSLPDDDDELAEAAGFGFDIDAFLAVKAEIMGCWTLCADGRWYHPTVCEIALDTWERRGAKRKAESTRKAEYRRQLREQDRTVSTEKSALVPQDTANCPVGHTDKSQRTTPIVPAGLGQQTDRQTDIEGSNEPLSSGADKSVKYPEPFEFVWKAYPHIRGRSDKPKSLGVWRRLPPETRAQLPAAIARYARDGREPKADCGAPAFERWLKAERYADWLAPDSSAQGMSDAERRNHYRETGMWKGDWGPKPEEVAA